ncbi:MAG TPA: thioredoxin domain-containing protein [Solirubrobacterales bacterium]|jgi:protein-disulfide isomerase|nr:thioredoxin domain-containing protein [Solirubrobacterales bacterium]
MSDDARRSRLLQLAAGAAFLAVAVVLVLIVITASGSGDGGDTQIEGKVAMARLLKGIPQQEMLLGDPDAPVELIEFGDLQCPVCAAYSEEVLPAIMETEVRKGEVKIDFRNLTIIGPESVTAGAAALAAGAQGRGWSFVDLFYSNQGGENSGYADDDAFLRAVARAAGVQNLTKWDAERSELNAKVEETSQEAENLGFTGTPSFAVKGPKTRGIRILGFPESAEELEAAIEEAR